MTQVPDLDLNNGQTIPQLGFGVFQIDPAETADAVSRAWRWATGTSTPRRCTEREGGRRGHPRLRPGPRARCSSPAS